ncbi:hypothetical protein D3C74_402230 [compost metagenome]
MTGAGKSAGNCSSNVLRALGPPVEEPIATSLLNDPSDPAEVLKAVLSLVGSFAGTGADAELVAGCFVWSRGTSDDLTSLRACSGLTGGLLGISVFVRAD